MQIRLLLANQVTKILVLRCNSSSQQEFRRKSALTIRMMIVQNSSSMHEVWFGTSERKRASGIFLWSYICLFILKSKLNWIFKFQPKKWISSTLKI